MTFPAPIRKKLVALLGNRWVKDDAVTLYSYRCDGLTLYSEPPMGVVFPGTVTECAALVRLLTDENIPFVPRGAGTGLSGGAVPRRGGVVIEMVRFNRIHELDLVNRTITVGPGVVNLNVSKAVAEHGYHFAPDPSSQKACTIGGNVAENSGGPHTLKDGVTVNHVLGLEVVLPTGEIVEMGTSHFGCPGPDLLGVFVGSEGTFGIVTKIICRLSPIPESVQTLLAVFDDVTSACRAVSAVIAAGIVPAAMEMIDALVIQAVEASFEVGFPKDAAAVLIVETEGLRDGLADESAEIGRILRDQGAVNVRQARDEEERSLVWQARKEAFGAIGHLSPSFYTQDGVIPRSALPQILEGIFQIGEHYGLRIGNVFHAGDGNLHPLILYNAHSPREVDATHQAGKDILNLCLRAGGTLSGEHGIGLEKADMMDQVFSAADRDEMLRVRSVFNPSGLLNPDKVFVTPGRCGEVKLVAGKSGVHV